MPVRACGITSVIHAMIMKDATAIACLAFASSGRGENHSASGTPTVRIPPTTLRVPGTANAAAGTVCSVVATNATQDEAYLARRIVAPGRTKLHSSRCLRDKFPPLSDSAPNRQDEAIR